MYHFSEGLKVGSTRLNFTMRLLAFFSKHFWKWSKKMIFEEHTRNCETSATNFLLAPLRLATSYNNRPNILYIRFALIYSIYKLFAITGGKSLLIVQCALDMIQRT